MCLKMPKRSRKPSRRSSRQSLRKRSSRRSLRKRTRPTPRYRASDPVYGAAAHVREIVEAYKKTYHPTLDQQNKLSYAAFLRSLPTDWNQYLNNSTKNTPTNKISQKSMQLLDDVISVAESVVIQRRQALEKARVTVDKAMADVTSGDDMVNKLNDLKTYITENSSTLLEPPKGEVRL